MTSRSSFTDEEWALLARAPLRAAMMVVAAEKGGGLRETAAIARAYGAAQQEFGGELLTELLKASPTAAIRRLPKGRDLPAPVLREALGIVERVGTPQESEDYRRLVLSLAEAAANAHKGVGTREREVLDAIAVTLYGADE